MTVLRLVDDRFLEQHSIRIRPRDLSISQAGELERSAEVLRTAAKAVADLHEALEARDIHGVIVAQRRLVAVGGLARPSADRLERSLRRV